MTTSPVMGITEEILGEIERAGWKLVPVKSSIEMEDAGCKVASRLMGLSEANRVYRAMLAAAPAAPVAQEPVQPLHDCSDGDFFALAGEAGGFLVCTAPPAAEQQDTVKVPREVLRALTDTAITEWHDPSENEAAQDRNECLCCGVEDGHNADCAVAIALRLLAGGAE